MTLTIPANDFGKIRVFSLSEAPSPELRAKSAAALEAIFGAQGLNPDYVDVVDINALDEFGLVGLLEEGYDFETDSVDQQVLRKLSGWVILLMSRATNETEVALTLAPGVRHETTLGDNAMLRVQARLESEGAKGVLEPTTKPPKSDARIGGMVATVALLVMFALVALMVWVGG